MAMPSLHVSRGIHLQDISIPEYAKLAPVKAGKSPKKPLS
jgi:hypothetical protein